VDILFSLGYPAEPGARAKKRKTLEEIREYRTEAP